MRWPWRKREGPAQPEAAAKAVEEAVQAREHVRGQWLPVLEASEDLRALNQRNHFADRLAHAYASRPAGASPVTPRRRSTD